MPETSQGWVRRSVGAAVWIVVAGALALIAGGGAFWFATHLGRDGMTCVVPDLAGLGDEDARRAAEGAGVVLEVVDERNDGSVPSGAVLSQDPPAGSQVRRGRKVRIVRSLGGERIEVPELEGEPAREVEIRLQQRGLAAGEEARAFRRLSPPGTVIAQVPAPGTIAGKDTRVHRLVSEGPVPVAWVMPDLTGQPLSRAEAWIEACGFRRGKVRHLPSDGTSAGVVVGQLPLSGHPIAARGVVELAVAQ
jgi:serine/threonine-protein kinase